MRTVVTLSAQTIYIAHKALAVEIETATAEYVKGGVCVRLKTIHGALRQPDTSAEYIRAI